MELGVKLDSITLNQTTKNSSEYHAIHPFGKIPGCKAKDGKTGIFESGAIMLYIADVAGSLPTPEARGAAAACVIWAYATCWPKLEESRGKCDLNALFGPVDAILEKQHISKVCSERFSHFLKSALRILLTLFGTLK